MTSGFLWRSGRTAIAGAARWRSRRRSGKDRLRFLATQRERDQAVRGAIAGIGNVLQVTGPAGRDHDILPAVAALIGDGSGVAGGVQPGRPEFGAALR